MFYGIYLNGDLVSTELSFMQKFRLFYRIKKRG